MIAFEVPGRPVTFRRPVNRKGGGRFNPPEMTAYKAKVNLLARAAGITPFDGPVEVGITIFSWLRGDLDNYAKNILDALKGVAYHDDQAQIRRLVIERVPTPSKGSARAVIRVKEYGGYNGTA